MESCTTWFLFLEEKLDWKTQKKKYPSHFHPKFSLHWNITGEIKETNEEEQVHVVVVEVEDDDTKMMISHMLRYH